MTDAPNLRPSVPPESASRHFDPVLRPDLAALYATRAARLRELAKGHELAEYLTLAAAMTEAQRGCLDGGPGIDSRDPQVIARQGDWPELLDRMIMDLRSVAPESILAHLDRLAEMPDAARREAALAMLGMRFDAVDPALALFLWSALSLEVAQAVRAAPLPPSGAQESDCCPLCGTAPVASVIHTGERQGLRYLHCALCDCEWHMVRAKCSGCGDSAQLDYLSFDTPEATVRAESCGACGGYLKVVSLERDPAAEVVAEDLASLVLDDAAAGEGFGRSGFNPFALPGG